MREMKDSGVPWIGEIPKEWTVHRIKTLFSERVELSDSGAETLMSVSEYYGVDSRSAHLDTDEYLSRSESLVGYKKCFPGDLVSNIMLAWKGSLGIAAQAGIVSPAYCVYKPSNNIFPMYYHYLFRTGLYTWQFKCYSKGIIDSRLRLYSQFFYDIPAIIPPLAEQRRIADFLDAKCAEIDSVLEKTKASIEEYKKLKQSVITEAVSKGVRGKRPMRDSGVEWIGEIPTEWELNKLKFIVQRITKGNGITKEEVFEDGDMPCVRYGEIYTKYNISFSKCVSATRLDIQTSPQYVQSGDILVVGTGELVEEIGKSIAYMGCDSCLAGGDIIVIKHDLNPLFLSYALNSNYAQTQRSCGKAKLKVVHISASEIGNLLIALPSPVEQQEIATYLDSKCAAIDALISSKEALVAELETYKKSIIYEYVTGKKEAIELT